MNPSIHADSSHMQISGASPLEAMMMRRRPVGRAARCDDDSLFLF